MTRFIVHSACGLVAAIALVAVPAEAKAQYVRPGVGISVATPGFGLNLGYNQAPIYTAPPIVVPAYSGYPVYSAGYGVYGPRPVVVPGVPYGTPYRGWHNHPYSNYGPYSHHGYPYGHR